MPNSDKDENDNTSGDDSIIINGDVSNSTIIIGDNSRFHVELKHALDSAAEKPDGVHHYSLALNSPTNSGCGLIGRDKNSGWN
jgi:hypothetical protein